ncbi:MATE family efflux transporter [Luteimonas aquatica]|uniref:MATE family efflux transporter n=1 Tax=Luteimonas aquatica TaxID=450364 RepID=UPI001F56CC29|nr:MATE family efflux transporter [Luteimonas aquatica]
MRDLTEGPIGRHLLRMSGVLLLNALAGTVFSLINIYWLGRLGVTAQAAVTLAAMPIMLVLVLLPVISMGAGVLIAHAVGAKDRDRVNRIFNEAFGASLIVSALVALLAWSSRDTFSHLMTGDAATAAVIAAYYAWFIPSVAVQIPMLILAGILEFTGNVRAGAIAQTGTVALGALLTPMLMFGWLGLPAMGVDGAGLAALLSCSVTMLGLLAYLARRNAYLRMRPATWLARPRELGAVLRIGVPAGIGSAVVAVSLLTVGLLLRPFGAVEQAAFGIGQRAFQAGLMPVTALAGAVCIVVGQNHGAGLPGRVREALRTGLLFAAVLVPLLLVVFETFAPWIGSRFSDDAAVVAAGAVFMRITALDLLPLCFGSMVFAVLSGTGNTRAGFVAQVAHMASLVSLAGGLSLLPGFRPVWIWGAMVCAGLAQAAMAGWFLHRAFGRRGVPEASSAETVPAAR